MLTERLHACSLRTTIQTAFVERVNLTLRQSIAGLARRTWFIHIAPSELEMHIRWYQASYTSADPMSRCEWGIRPKTLAAKMSSAAAPVRL